MRVVASRSYLVNPISGGRLPAMVNFMDRAPIMNVLARADAVI
jgi:hypothetical protein